jgi:type IV pilus assembly protein PilV
MRDRGCQSGVSLIEILASLVVVSLGILGVTALQMSGIRSANDGYLYSQAAALAEDMAERIRVNPQARARYVLAMAASHSTSTDCETSKCSSDEMASYDLRQWTTALAERLPDGAGAITYAAGSVNSYSLTVRWHSLNEGNCDAQGGAGTEYWCFRLSVNTP